MSIRFLTRSVIVRLITKSVIPRWVMILLLSFAAFTKLQAEFRDPTQPSQNYLSPGATETSSVLSLNGIIHSGKEKKALINAKLVKQGDLIQDYLVKEISDNQVILVKGKESLQLNLIAKTVEKYNLRK